MSMSVSEALRNSSKGRLSYDRTWATEGRTKQVLDEISRQNISLHISPEAIRCVLRSEVLIKNKEDDQSYESKALSISCNLPGTSDRKSKQRLSINTFEDAKHLKRACEIERALAIYEKKSRTIVKLLFEEKEKEYENFSKSLYQKYENSYERFKSNKNQHQFEENSDPKIDENIEYEKDEVQVIEKDIVEVGEIPSDPLEQNTCTTKGNDTRNDDTRLQEQMVLKQNLVILVKYLISNMVHQIREKLESCSDKNHFLTQWDVFTMKLMTIIKATNEMTINSDMQDISGNTIIQMRQLTEDAKALILEAEKFIRAISSHTTVTIPDLNTEAAVPNMSSQVVVPNLDSQITPPIPDAQITAPKLDAQTALPKTKMEPFKPVVTPFDNASHDASTVPNSVQSREASPERMEECDIIEEPVAHEEPVTHKEPASPARSKQEIKLGPLQEYIRAVQYLTTIENDIKSITTDAKFKKYKLNLHKAVTIPINAISSCTASHLRDKMNRLVALLSGQTVSCGGSQVSCQNHPHAVGYCKKLIAEKLVNQAEEQVASRFASAFPYAAVIVDVCVKFPDVWTLMLGQFYQRCPYLAPLYPEREEEQSDVDYYMTLGYKYFDGELEERDKFLKRMSGLMRLYAAIMYTTLSFELDSPHLHGVAHAWTWLAHILNMEPRPDITATLLFDFLEVLGNSMAKIYGKQFEKILQFIYRDFFPVIKSAISTTAAGPVIRLENFLQNVIKKGRIEPPEGALDPNFWKT